MWSSGLRWISSRACARPEEAGDAVTTPESAFVFNIVWTGSVFPYLSHLVASQQRHSDARFRFVANGCPPDQVRLMEDFAATADGRVVDVFGPSTTRTRHGAARDAVLAARADGEFFCSVAPDSLAEGEYLRAFADVLGGGCAGVTSGRGVWTDNVVVPAGHPGVPGECFYSQDGFLFGSPHFAMYHRETLEDTMARWGVGFGSAGAEDDRTKAALTAAGHDYIVYDTGKIANVLLQIDGKRLCHFEHDALLHIGGVSHYLSPPEHQHDPEGDGKEPVQKNWPWPKARYEVARFTGALLRSLCDGDRKSTRLNSSH